MELHGIGLNCVSDLLSIESDGPEMIMSILPGQDLPEKRARTVSQPKNSEKKLCTYIRSLHDGSKTPDYESDADGQEAIECRDHLRYPAGRFIG